MISSNSASSLGLSSLVEELRALTSFDRGSFCKPKDVAFEYTKESCLSRFAPDCFDSLDRIVNSRLKSAPDSRFRLDEFFLTLFGPFAFET
jgi:hypothetical protein